ncbi:M20/M25/M40 family metallo-hydrolase [Paenisporosarcina quisquiliarum]|uniref:M20/M25/M40 family metallo-hydrolase n=1 Tax=Paenisporosarcina quisquiliarum TaxID=365346 RepID=A0A9X3LFW8_9BACL|nr:M20/M25/M40 family metallo-hydrolase [Paenisporosarcina quisquiliarum]
MQTALQEVKPIIEEVFHHLHTHPEISWKEFETTKYIKRLLEGEDFQIETFDDSTGLVVTVGTGNSCVGLRTDIDALWQEVENIYQPNHSCGHDGHMTMAIGALLVLKKIGYPKTGRLKVIFQPAEEKGTGAFSARLVKPGTTPFKGAVVVFGAAAFGASFIGFITLVGTVYPVMGYLGFTLIAAIVYAWVKKRGSVGKGGKRVLGT